MSFPAGEVAIVIPSIGRPTLQVLLQSIADSGRQTGLRPPPVYVVDDRTAAGQAELEIRCVDLPSVEVLRSNGAGPAAARNKGWHRCRTTWVSFLDDDVLVSADWLHRLAADLRQAGPSVGGIQGRITVPLPPTRRPRDWERGTAGLQTARWITADMVYRRAALVMAGGFDERFPRAFREDSDLALRVVDSGFELTRGSRETFHPVRPARWWASVVQQRGNSDDVLMRRLHGPDWRARAGAPLGRRPAHLATTAMAATAISASIARYRRLAAAAAIGWTASTVEFAWRRIAPGPRDAGEVVKMVTTSVAIPPAAAWYWIAGLVRHRSAARWPGADASGLPSAVLVDRDGTIVRNVPYNGNPTLVEPMPGARQALSRIRAAGIPIVVISNQSGVGRGLISAGSVAAVNERIEEMLGPFDGWLICPHTDRDRCSCRKPQPGLIHRAARQLGVPAEQCVVIGDIGSDMAAAAAAGASGILVPTPATLPAEVDAAPLLAGTLGQAVDAVLTGAWCR